MGLPSQCFRVGLVFKAFLGTAAIADVVLYLLYLFGSQRLAVVLDKTLLPIRESRGKVAGIVEVEADGTESIEVAVDADMRASATGCTVGMRLREAYVEERTEDVGAVGDVEAGTFPLQHSLMEDAARINI